MSEATKAAFEEWEGWAILELMGHRRLGGYVREVTLFGAAMCRIDVPGDDGKDTTQVYAPSAIYCVTPTTEEIARALARTVQPSPVQRWELPQLGPASPSYAKRADEEEGGGEGDDLPI